MSADVMRVGPIRLVVIVEIDNGGIMPGTIQSFFATIDPISPPP